MATNCLQVSATNSLARREVRRCGVTERGNGVKECEYISNVRDTRNVLNVITTSTILLNSAPQLESEVRVYQQCEGHQ